MIIKTERLVLRPFVESDAEDVFEYLKEPAVNCFACMKLNSLEEAKAEMKKRVGETEYYFAITLKESGKVIEEFTLMWKIIIYQASICAKDSVCEKKANLRSLCRL